MLKGSADTKCQINLGFNCLARSPDLTRFFKPFGIHNRPGTGNNAAHGLCQFFSNFDIILILDAAADRNQDILFGNVDIAGFGFNNFQKLSIHRQVTDLG